MSRLVINACSFFLAFFLTVSAGLAFGYESQISVTCETDLSQTETCTGTMTLPDSQLLPPLTAEEGLEISAMMLALWASAWVWKSTRRVT